MNVEDSAAWIIQLAKRARRAGSTAAPTARAELCVTVRAGWAMFSVVSGISRVMARSLLAAHGSMSAVAAVAPRVCVATPASVGCEPLD